MYIHYGKTSFDINKFEPIRNDTNFTKPHGGFWASRIGAAFGWKEWCEQEEFRECKIENSFQFQLNKDAYVRHIHSLADLHSLPRILNNTRPSAYDWCLIDFERCVNLGIDSIELYLSDAYETLYYALYGWDCDSILILNPKIVEVIPSAPNQILLQQDGVQVASVV